MWPIEVAYPPLLKEIDKYRKFFRERGVEIEFNPFVGKFSGKDYPAAYTKEEIKKFNLKIKIRKSRQNGRLCNAGYNAVVAKSNGNINPCMHLNADLGNLYKGIKFKDKMVFCHVNYCACPLNMYDPYLFEKALKQNNIKIND